MRTAIRSIAVWPIALLVALAGAVALPGKVGFAAPDEDAGWIADKNGCKVANPFPRPGETITWSGECKDGLAQGQGVLQWYLDGQEDDRYEGNLELGWAEGHGVLVRLDGSKYEGDWKQSQQHGNGRFEAPDGSWYEGQWKDGKPHGQGQYRRPDGKIFIGVWIDGVYEGDIESEPDDDNYDPNRT
jgi:hypothetical protein